MKGLLEVTRREAIVTSKDLETFNVQPWEFSWYTGLGTLLCLRWEPKEEQPILISPSKPGCFKSEIMTMRLRTMEVGLDLCRKWIIKLEF